MAEEALLLWELLHRDDACMSWMDMSSLDAAVDGVTTRLTVGWSVGGNNPNCPRL
eukprot:CAMPEP_0172479724 /NCGR_PEP_ID=MMETSP1066-20121228/4503_1 /TAXON_ID=671091 /ORGANISM="Coscinodiscus wailesii, Strain CCMP2513" /LENGTH=54 /DNA_ID=CAMNT_0013240429 /DNA_START=1 /DNA_END=165 /DNA_ORIENTATION=-